MIDLRKQLMFFTAIKTKLKGVLCKRHDLQGVVDSNGHPSKY